MRELTSKDIDSMQKAFDYAGIGKIKAIQVSNKVCIPSKVKDYADKKGLELRGSPCIDKDH